MHKKHLRIAILGYGTVGKSTVDILQQRATAIAKKSGVSIHIESIVLRKMKKDLQESVQAIVTCDQDAVLSSDDIDCYVELIGGVGDAYTIVKYLLSRGKYVVTANKALLALHGEELWALARKNHTCIGFEASCCAGLPLIRAIVDGLIANTIQGIFGIVNGTCNFILTQMEEKNMTYQEALEQATKQGIAEADSSLDILGVDAAHKIAIMSSLAFSLKVSFNDIAVEGISSVTQIDMRYAQQLGYTIKLIAAAYRIDEGIAIWVRPVFLAKDHPLASVHDTFNAVSIFGDTNGHTLYYGRGAGGLPTASAVVSDIISIGIGNWQRLFEHSRQWQDINESRNQIPIEMTTHRYYLRMHVDDRHGVLAEITALFDQHHISIASVLQEESATPTQAMLIIITHETREKNIHAVVDAIVHLSCVHESPKILPIFHGYQEAIGIYADA